jgi:hypothetical protein
LFFNLLYLLCGRALSRGAYFGVNNSAMNIFKKVTKYILIVFFCLLFILVLFPVKRGGSALKKANADSLNAYPTVCLGGWQNPSYASGQPDTQTGSNSFSNGNSAVLDQAAAQIFCGSFQSGDESKTPTSITLHFSWNVVFPTQSITPVSTDTDSSAWGSVLDTTSTASSTPPATTTDTTDQGQTDITATTTAPTDNSGDSGSSQDVTPPPSSTPDDSGSNQGGTSLFEKLIQDPLSLLIEKTFADSGDGAENFVDVSYSLNGTVWQDLGQVSESGWQNFSVTIPVSSWGDINKLQIQLNPLLSMDAPTIYLDGMWLEVDYNQSLGGILQDGANAAFDAVGSLSDAVNGALDSATNALTDILPSATTTIESVNAPIVRTETGALPSAEPPSLPPPPPTHNHTFQVNGGTLRVNVNNPRWVPPSGVASYAAGVAAEKSAGPAVTLVDENTIRVSGACSSYYYTILLFRNQTDYQTNPAAAVFNEAIPCANGNFDRTFSDMDFPSALTPGTYYLMVARQGQTGSWVPYPTLYPIVIGNAPPSDIIQ